MRGGAVNGRGSRRPWPSALLSAVALLCAVVTCSHAYGSMDGRTKISAGDLEKLINRPNTTVVHGTLDLEEGQVVEGNVVVIEGDLEMQSGSAVHGDAIVVAGDALLNGQCTIDGDLRIVTGFYYASDHNARR
jgi:formylmethanofuran dehydrogenase subunit C